MPDLVKVAYFDGTDGLARFRAEPAHDHIERELYPASVAQSIWLTAREHPSAGNVRSVAS